jgi:hypothetical protein
MAQRRGCINGAFRKEMTLADANFVEKVTQRNFHSRKASAAAADEKSK